MPSEIWYFSLQKISPGLMYTALALVILEQMWTGLLYLKKPQKLVCKRPFCDFGLWEPPLTRIQLEFFVKAKSKKGLATTKVASLFDALLEAKIARRVLKPSHMQYWLRKKIILMWIYIFPNTKPRPYATKKNLRSQKSPSSN